MMLGLKALEISHLEDIMKRETRNLLLLLLTAFIWGVAFVAQSEGGQALGAFTFNGTRSLIAALALQPVIFAFDKLKMSSKKPQTPEDKRTLYTGGFLCGIALFVASSLQQLGLNLGTGSGKAGFITACYILIVPILSLLFGKKCNYKIWIGVFLSLVGLYLLCINGSLSFQTSDLYVMGCAFVFAIQILLVDYYSPKVDGVRLSALQFLTTGILSLPFIIFKEIPAAGSINAWFMPFLTASAIISLLYASCLSGGVAYTLQIIAQNGLNPTIASMAMSLESVFAVLAGWVILGQALSPKEILGCILIFTAIILAQL